MARQFIIILIKKSVGVFFMEAYVMDAFSARLFGGNQAGVVLPEHPLDDGVMQQIAAEFKHSETAFAAVEPVTLAEPLKLQH